MCFPYGRERPNQAFTYGYDRYGNRWSQTATQGSGPQPQFSFDSITNRIAGYAYDAAGNVTSDGIHSYAYDAEGNQVAVDGGSTEAYTFDALNNRVRRISGSAIDDYGYDLAGKRASRWDGTAGAASLTEAYLHWNGQLFAGYGAGQVLFRHADLNGTSRLTSLYNGTTTAITNNLPFGKANGTVPPIQFAGLWADTASNTDLAIFREYSLASGRWMSPDPYDGSYDRNNPQSLNRYSYVLNNPLLNVDPTGYDTTDGPSEGGGGDNPPASSFDANGGWSTHSGSGSLGDAFQADLGSILSGVAPGSQGTAEDPNRDNNLESVLAELAAAGFRGPSNTENPPPCQAKILSATNNQFGTNYTDANVSSTFNYSTEAGPGQGTLNLNITGSTAGVSPGYYPVHWYSYIIGYGPTLHVVSGPGGNGGLDSQMTVLFGPNQGTFHIDSAFPHNPFGAIIHGIINMTKLAGYPKC